MRRLYPILVFLGLWLSTFPTIGADITTYHLKDGNTIEGTPQGFGPTDVLIEGPNQESVGRHKKYEEFTQDSLKVLLKQAPRPEDKANIEPYITDFALAKVKQREIELKPVARLERPATHTGVFAMFTSPVGLAIIFLIYAANLYAAYEISAYKNIPPGRVCGFSAIAPVAAPIVFLSISRPSGVFKPAPAAKITETGSIAELAELAEPRASGPVVTEIAAEGSIAPAAPTAPTLPDPVTFKRGEFSFNRRFFETKMPGFFRVIPSEKEKDLLLRVKSARGDYTGRRISRIGPGDLSLEIAKGGATADETIPFIDITEVQIRHKDLPPE